MSIFDLIYTIAILLFSPFLAFKLLFDRIFRNNFIARLIPDVSVQKSRKTWQSKAIWVHAASIGEVRLAIRLIHAWLQIDKNRSFFITTNTLQSKKLADKETTVPVLLAPFDFSPTVGRFIRLTDPQHLILIETEIWPNMVRLMAELGQITIVNGRLSDRYFSRYLKGRFLFAKTIRRLDWVLARDQISAERFQRLGVPKNLVLNHGSLKFEVPQPPEKKTLVSIKSHYLVSRPSFLFVAGSVQPEELGYILPAWKSVLEEIPGFQMILIPRHPQKRDEFTKILTQSEINFSISSELSTLPNKEEKNHILVVDQMGVLKSWYFLADSIFVGGSLCNKGGQNMVEAVGYKKPVCIGPYAINFKDEVDLLLSVDGLKIVHNSDELYAFMRMCYEQPGESGKIGERGYQLIVEQAHALDENIEKLLEIY